MRSSIATAHEELLVTSRKNHQPTSHQLPTISCDLNVQLPLFSRWLVEIAAIVNVNEWYQLFFHRCNCDRCVENYFFLGDMCRVSKTFSFIELFLLIITCLSFRGRTQTHSRTSTTTSHAAPATNRSWTFDDLGWSTAGHFFIGLFSISNVRR